MSASSMPGRQGCHSQLRNVEINALFILCSFRAVLQSASVLDLGSEPRQFVEIDIAAGDDDADALAFEHIPVLQDRGQRHGAAWFHHDPQVLPRDLHRVDDLLLGRGEDVGHEVRHEVPGIFLQRNLETIGDGHRCVVSDDVTRLEGRGRRRRPVQARRRRS